MDSSGGIGTGGAVCAGSETSIPAGTFEASGTVPFFTMSSKRSKVSTFSSGYHRGLVREQRAYLDNFRDRINGVAGVELAKVEVGVAEQVDSARNPVLVYEQRYLYSRVRIDLLRYASDLIKSGTVVSRALRMGS